MSIEVVMPQLGLTMEEGTVSAWLKKSGEPVKKDELLFSVSTDKVEMEVESVAEGVLGKIVQPAGSTVPVGTVLAYIESSKNDSTAPVVEVAVASAPIRHEEIPSGKAIAAKANDNGKASTGSIELQRKISPRARRLAKELGIDLAGVQANALHGEITEEDVLHAAERQKASPRVDVRRQLIAERLTQSIQIIPAFSVAAEVNAENLVALHESLNSSANGRPGVRLTITDLLLSAFARALKASPELNATWEENGIRSCASVDLGLAVAAAKGVVAPVIHHADIIDLRVLAAHRSALVEKARAGKLALSDMEGGVGTLSNLGMYRVDHFQAVIAPGQSCILAVGQIRERPWAEKTLSIKRTMMLNLTVDHRVADGAIAATCLEKMIGLIENPSDLSGAMRSGDSEGRRSNG